MKLSLGVIVKDQAQDVRRIVENYGKYFDEMVFAVDDGKALASLKEEFAFNEKIKLLSYEWKEDFADKRNLVAKNITGDYYVRIDTDDYPMNPEMFRPVAESAKADNLAIVYCWYDYSKDAWGNTNAGHYRETIIKNSDNLFWNKTVHENVLAKDRAGHTWTINKDIKIEHRIDENHAANSALRNMKILLAEYNKDKENTDPRTIGYLGRMFYTARDYQKALFFLQKHIETSGWDEDKYLSWVMLSNALLSLDRAEEAIGACFEAIQERPDYPQAYSQLHDIYFSKNDYKKAIVWGEAALSKKLPDTFVMLDPSSEWRLALSMAFCYLNVGEVDKAKTFFDYGAKRAPTLDFVVENRKLFQEAVDNKAYMERFFWMVQFLREADPKRLNDLIASVPARLRGEPVFTSALAMFGTKKKWSDKSIVFFCGDTAEPWADPSINFGIGGSETAVIHMSRQLSKLGYEVTVFCNCTDMAGTYNGVEYKLTGEFNPRDEYNIVVSWRSDIFQFGDIIAKKKITWVHDLPANALPVNGKPEADIYLALSEYHKNLFPEYIPKEKVVVTTNGIDPALFARVEGIEAKDGRLIYASSYDRGLEILLDNWREIRKECPWAELHIYYGWETYDKLCKLGLCDGSAKKKLAPKMEQEGVFNHGRVSHQDLIKEYKKAQVFSYPCTYAGEINCIALTQAIASGCLCVTNDHPCMAERNPHIVSKDFVKDLIDAIKTKKRPDLMEGYIAKNSWESVAKDWQERILCQ